MKLSEFRRLLDEAAEEHGHDTDPEIRVFREGYSTPAKAVYHSSSNSGERLEITISAFGYGEKPITPQVID